MTQTEEPRETKTLNIINTRPNRVAACEAAADFKFW